jgi:uncharacterized protein YkwD
VPARRIGRLFGRLTLLVSLLAVAPADAYACRGADGTRSEASIRQATLCLLNRERRGQGQRPLQLDDQLTRAAELHSRDMVRGRFFEHVSPQGSTMVDRILRTGYARRHGWALGENLAWAEGELATPRAVVRSWMASPGHRVNILDPRFREIGIGIVRGNPCSGAGGLTYTTDFGVLT